MTSTAPTNESESPHLPRDTFVAGITGACLASLLYVNIYLVYVNVVGEIFFLFGFIFASLVTILLTGTCSFVTFTLVGKFRIAKHPRTASAIAGGLGCVAPFHLLLIALVNPEPAKIATVMAAGPVILVFLGNVCAAFMTHRKLRTHSRQSLNGTHVKQKQPHSFGDCNPNPICEQGERSHKLPPRLRVGLGMRTRKSEASAIEQSPANEYSESPSPKYQFQIKHMLFVTTFIAFAMMCAVQAPPIFFLVCTYPVAQIVALPFSFLAIKTFARGDQT